MINALIINENNTRNNSIRVELRKFKNKLKVFATLSEDEDFVPYIEDTKTDLVFWEISNITNEIMTKASYFILNELDFVLISNLKDLAYDAIRLNAAGFILNPAHSFDINFCIQRVIKRIEEKYRRKQQQKLLESIHERLFFPDSLGIPTLEGIQVLRASEIFRCEGIQRCTIVYTRSGKKLISSYNIGEFVKLLSPFNFFAVHKSHLVNLGEVQYVSKENYLLMSDEVLIPIARRRRSEFLAKIPRP